MGEKPVYPSHFYKMKEGEQAIDKTPASEVFKGKTIAGWIIEDEDMIKDISLGTMEDPKMVRIGRELDPAYEEQIIKIPRDYKDVFAWTYKDMKANHLTFVNTRWNSNLIPSQSSRVDIK